MIPTNSQSQLLAYQAPDRKTVDPEQQVRTIVESIITPDTLPPTRSLQLYHVRGVGNSRYTGGEDKDVVIYPPEFVYLLDVGFPTISAVVLGTQISGLGDPHFPDFSIHVVRTVFSRSARDIIFQGVTGTLMITVRTGTDENTVHRGLAPYVKSVRRLLTDGDVYLAKVIPFYELEKVREIEDNVPFVLDAQPDTVVRFVDFFPGWLVDRVC